jgi:hypothetical protein
MNDTAHDDIGPLVLSITALTTATFALGIFLVPVWPPEVILVLAAAAFSLTLFAQIAAARNAVRRGELAWVPPIILLGPVGALAYSVIKTTESGILSYYLEQLSRQIGGEAEGE